MVVKPVGVRTVQSVVQRTQIRIDLLREITRKETEPLSRLDRGSRENETRDFPVAQRRNAEGDGQIAFSRAGRPCREHEVVTADRLDIATLIDRLRGDPLPTDRRRDHFAQLLRCADGRVLRLADETLQRGFAQVVVAIGQRAHRADKLADTRDVRGIASDAQLRTTRDDLHRELAFDAIDVRVVVPSDEHHLVRIGDEDGDLRRRAHEAAFSFSIAPTSAATVFPSARSFVCASTLGMTFPMSRGPAAPVSATTRSTIARSSASDICSGR